MKLAPLFSLSLQHEYYTDKVSSDFIVEPTAGCNRLLKGHRLRMKNKQNGIQIIATLDEEDQLFIPLSEDLKFTFLLKLKSNDFLQFTQLEDRKKNFIYYYNNKKVSKSETNELVSSLNERPVYLSPSSNTFGIIEISNNAGSLATLDKQPLSGNTQQAIEFSITFKAQKRIWRYYLISNEKNAQFSIEDSTGAISFSQAAIADDDVRGQKLSIEYPNYSILQFVSSEAIAYQQQLPKSITLKKGSEVIIPSLPVTDSRSQVVNLIKPATVANWPAVQPLTPTVTTPQTGTAAQVPAQKPVTVPPPVVSTTDQTASVPTQATGTATNQPAQQPQPSQPIAPAEVAFPGPGLRFDGKKSYVCAPIEEPNSNITHELWFKTESDDIGLFSFYTGTPGGSGSSDRQLYSFDGKIKSYLYKHGSLTSSSLNIDDGEWHHVAHVIGDDGQKVYIDGKVVKSGSEKDTLLDRKGQIVVGYARSARRDFFKGRISEVRIWEKSRSGEEIVSAMNQRLKGDEPGLLAYWPLNEGTGIIAKDLSGKGNNGMIHDAIW